MPNRKVNAAELAKRFAEVLDRREYEALAELLSSDCEYQLHDRVVRGTAAIMQEYRNATEWAFDVFDRIEFASDVRSESEHFARVTFTDRLYVGEFVHEYKCQQVVATDQQGRIKRIVHVELKGESTTLDLFFRKCGVSRPSNH